MGTQKKPQEDKPVEQEQPVVKREEKRPTFTRGEEKRPTFTRGEKKEEAGGFKRGGAVITGGQQ